MVIQSKWVDYYDHIGKRYGEDRTCVYARGTIKTETQPRVRGGLWFPWNFDNGFLSWPVTFPPSQIYRELYFLVVGVKAYPIVKYGVGEFHAAVFRDGMARVPAYAFRYATHGGETSIMTYLPKSEALAALVRIVGVPVFLVYGDSYPGPKQNSGIVVCERVPVLRLIHGLPERLSAAEAWQNIYATLQNVIRESPDTKPPVEVDNEHKIHAAGFDLKTSFRHPVNRKQKR